MERARHLGNAAAAVRRLTEMRRVAPVMMVALATLVAACGGDEGATAGASPATTSAGLTTTTVRATTTTEAPATTTTTSPATGTTLAGEPIDFGPAEGDVLMVIGVRHDDVLNLRGGPGVSGAILGEIPPMYTDLVALGTTHQLPESFWIEIDYQGTEGWVHMGYIGYEGSVDDRTSSVVDELGEIPVAASMTDLGELVAGVFASDEPEPDIVQVTAVTRGDLAEVTYDVVGLGDDAVRGLRLHLFADMGEDGFGLKSVEVTTICGRGVSGDGLCV